jgi:hypothetical protein
MGCSNPNPMTNQGGGSVALKNHLGDSSEKFWIPTRFGMSNWPKMIRVTTCKSAAGIATKIGSAVKEVKHRL